MNNYYYIVDSSYVIYFAANSAFAQYERDFDLVETDLGPTFNPLIDPEFNYIYEERFLRCIQNPVQRVIPFVDNSRFVFCLDCQRKNIWRREFFPEYKIQRDVKDTSKDKFDIGKAFEYAYKKLIPDFCSQYGASVIRCEYAEGDDCIAVSKECILKNDKLNKVIIIGSDKDLVQLYDDRTAIVTCKGEIREPKHELENAIKDTIKENITTKDFLLWKIILGDKSDGIPNIKPGLGNKKAFLLVQDKEKLKALLSEDVNAAKSFKRNKMLISLDLIPETVKSLIEDEINNILFKN